MTPNLVHYQPVPQSLWAGRSDSLSDERFFQKVQCIDLRSDDLKKKPQTVFLGFCSDEGIRRNQGRTGAADGPDALRKQLAKLASHQPQSYIDIGNIHCIDKNLEASQQQFATLIDYCHQQDAKTIAFGGGHEIAWAHYMGLATHYPKMGIINFDAHFDLRPLKDERFGTSGTPFWQIQHDRHHNSLSFDYCCLGIQPVANTQSLFTRAKDYGVSYLTADQMVQESFTNQVAFLNDFMSRHEFLYVSICLDVFAECYAPGVSAPQALGINPWSALQLLKIIAQTGKVISIDVAELSPRLDQEERTSRLAAVLIAELLNLKEYKP
jgi:formiminoglutamase